MRLEEYFKVRGNRNLGREELIMFGVRDLEKGWTKRYKDNEITTQQLEEMYYNERCTRKAKAKIKAFMLGKKQTKVKVNMSNKYVYVILNENGRVKIGISLDPIKRAQNLSTSSGYACKCVCYWELGEHAAFLEKTLHTRFDKYRMLGEWFSPDLKISQIEEAMSSYTKFSVSQYMEQSVMNN